MGVLRGSKTEFTVSTIAEIEGKKINFSATFRRRPWGETNAIANDISDGLATDPPKAWRLMASTIKEDLTGWKLEGEGGPVEFNDENIDEALSIYGYLHGLYKGWNSAQMQQPSVNSKN